MSSKITLLQDLDEMAAQVRTPAAKSYIEEAIACYRAGANRASIVTTWIAVCADIIEKIRELAFAGDKQAKEIEAKFKNNDNSKNPSAMAPFERDIIKYAENKFQFVSLIEATHLRRIQEDRHVCAHPTFSDDGEHYSPNAEQARLHIVNACNYLLIHPPTQGKVLVEKLFASVNRESFPKEIGEIRDYLLAPGYLEKAKPTVKRNFLILIFKRLFADSADIELGQGDRFIGALSAMSLIDAEAFREIFNEKVGTILRDAEDQNFKRLYWLLLNKPECWDLLDEAAQSRSTSLISSLSSEDIIKYGLCKSSNVSAIGRAVLDRIGQLGDVEKGRVLASGSDPFTKGLAIEHFIKSDSFHEAYENGMQVLIPHASYFDDNDLKEVLSGSRENKACNGINQILSANGIDEVFSELYRRTKHLSGTRKLWKDFWENIPDGYERGRFRKVLVAVGAIDPPSEDGNEDEEIPF